ncbi:hypothetical protein KR009_009345 [Drosophila setifemur]|nr:hypothetical protein KR009_009345 [Drosophila setifemur]
MAAKGARSIQVAIKVRPCEPGCSSLWQVRKDGNSIQLVDSHAEPCVFDHVFDQGATNQEVFDRMAKHIVHACMQGFNGTIFAYGQTSSGKTYTMMGDTQNPGVMVLAAKEIFRQISDVKERDFLLRVGYIEIYNEKIYDLLNKKNQDLKIQEAGHGMVNVNCDECIITCEEDLLRYLGQGNKERTVGETNMNERSSRSHAIFRIIIESRKSNSSEDDSVIQSVLNLVDLAGSERADQTGARGARLKEGGHINKSLLFLSNVIKNLAERESENNATEQPSKYISFRDSKLTRILQASLGGNAFTSIICTIKPSIMEESQSTLSFAMRAKKIRIKPQLNEMVSDATMMKRLEREIKALKDRLAEEERKNESQLKVQELERCIKRDMLKIISSASLSDKRLQKRRRTWCPTNSSEDRDPDSPQELVVEESRLPRPSRLSQLPKPTFFSSSHIPGRSIQAPKTINTFQTLKEEFASSESMGFGHGLAKVPEESGEAESYVTPKKDSEEPADMRINLISLNSSCDALQAEVTVLRASNQAANVKIRDFEEQVKSLKDTIEKMEMEGREAVSLSLRLESREKNLLSTISEKDSAIENLQKSLDELSRDVLRHSKDADMRSVCPELESSCERICHKCQELERLLPLADAQGLETIACECDQLRSEIAATRLKLESVQSAFSQASCEVTQKTGDCERLSRQISSAQDDFGLLQGQYESLEQQWKSQQSAIEAMQADYEEIQRKYHQLQVEYEQANATSTERCHHLEADNTRLQAEIGVLKERVEQAQRQLTESSRYESLAQEFKEQNDQLKKQLMEVEENFNEIQREYDCMSNQLMESVQENDVLREELKQRPSPDLESMKSSGVGTDSSEPVEEQDFVEEFARISESLIQIELQDHSGGSRFFRACKLEGELDQGAIGLRLCMDSAKYSEDEDTPDGVVLKGLLKQSRFQIVKLSVEEIALKTEEEKRLLKLVTDLEEEVRAKNALMEATECTINNMREQMICLESALLEKSVIVNQVEDYQRQIESLEKEKAEMSLVCEELQEKVLRENTLTGSVHFSDETLPDSQDSEEVVTLKASLAELKSKVCQLQGEVESQLKQMQLKDRNIQQLQTEIQELGERCLSLEVRQVELEAETGQKQQQLDRQALKLTEDALLIDQLQESKAILLDRSIKAEKSLADLQERLDLAIPPSEYAKQIEELKEKLERAKVELSTKTDEMNALQLEYMEKIDASEGENRASFRRYNLEWEESRENYESSLATLKEQLVQAGEELSKVTTRCQTELEEIRGTLEKKLSQAKEEREKATALHQAELEKIRETLKEKLREQAKIEALHSKEVEEIVSKLKSQLSQALGERDEVSVKLEEMKSILAEMIRQKDLEIDKAHYQAELEEMRDTLEKELRQAEEERVKTSTRHQEELLSIRETLKVKEEEQARIEALHSAEVEEIGATFKEQLNQAIEERDKVSVKLKEVESILAETIRQKDSDKAKTLYQAELEEMRDSLEKKLHQAELERDKATSSHQVEVERIRETLKVKEEEHARIEALHSVEVEEVRASIKEHLTQAEEERDKVSAKLEAMKSIFAETKAKAFNLEKSKAEQDLALNNLAMEKLELETLYKKSQELVEQLRMQLKSREQDSTKALNQQFEELQRKCDQQDADLDNLKKEKCILQSKIEDATAQHSGTLKDLQELESQMDARAKQNELDKCALEEKIETFEAKISDLEEQLEKAQQKVKAQDELVTQHEELKISLATSTGVSFDLQRKVEQLNCELITLQQGFDGRDGEVEQLRKELQDVVAAKQSVSDEQELLVKKLQEVEGEVSIQAGRFQKEVADLQGSVKELELKLKSLEEQKEELKSGNEDLKVKLRNAHSRQKLLEGERKLIGELKESQAHLEEQLRAKEAEMNIRTLEMSGEVERRCQSLGDLMNECEKLRSDLVSCIYYCNRNSLLTGVTFQESKTNSFQKEKDQMDSDISKLLKEKQELDDNLKALRESDAQLVAQLRAKDAASSALRRASIEDMDTANKKCHEKDQKIQQLTKECEKLRSAVKTKEASSRREKDGMQGTICSLLEDKRNLEEKLCTLNEIVSKLEGELNSVQASSSKSSGSNMSYESNVSGGSPASASAAPAARKNPDRNSHGASVPRKSISFGNEVRKNRRITAHDENRKNSYWNDFREASTMTDPVGESSTGYPIDLSFTFAPIPDNNCSCAELNAKLETCQRELFIRESQVTALQMELKHHPLKDENVLLKKRFMEEQESARFEQKILKQRIHDLNARICEFPNQKASTTKPSNQSQNGNPALVSVETQTESDLEEVLEKTNAKYENAVRLLRFRYNLINDLEERLKQNENFDTSNSSSLTIGQINSLKAQCESQKKEMANLQEKYEAAKKILQIRKDELQDLRAKIADSASSAN